MSEASHLRAMQKRLGFQKLKNNPLCTCSITINKNFRVMLADQYHWLDLDLSAVNRAKTPWVVVGLHQPFYCSPNDDSDHCHKPVGLPHSSNFFASFLVHVSAYDNVFSLTLFAHYNNIFFLTIKGTAEPAAGRHSCSVWTRRTCLPPRGRHGIWGPRARI